MPTKLFSLSFPVVLTFAVVDILYFRVGVPYLAYTGLTALATVRMRKRGEGKDPAL
jgi:hypothetical protein